jgi:hypothetical protein
VSGIRGATSLIITRYDIWDMDCCIHTHALSGNILTMGFIKTLLAAINFHIYVDNDVNEQFA